MHPDDDLLVRSHVNAPHVRESLTADLAAITLDLLVFTVAITDENVEFLFTDCLGHSPHKVVVMYVEFPQRTEFGHEARNSPRQGIGIQVQILCQTKEGRGGGESKSLESKEKNGSYKTQQQHRKG